MDSDALKQQLAEVEERVTLGERHLERQRFLIIAKLELIGGDTAEAIALLRLLEELQAEHVARRDRLRDEFLSASKGA